MIAIPLTKGYEAYIDPQDMERVAEFKWCVQISKGKSYASRSIAHPSGKRKTIWLHRFILNAPEGIEVDHKDGDGLNCCRDNIRLATRSQNCMNSGPGPNNTSGYKGIGWSKREGQWRVRLVLKGHDTHIGYFKDIKVAIERYRQAVIKYHGEFAWNGGNQ